MYGVKDTLTTIIVCTALTSSAFSHDAAGGCGEQSTMDEAIDELAPISSATHRFIGSGQWSEPSNWSSNSLPTTDDDQVLIQRGASAILDFDVSDVRLKTLRIDGSLTLTSQNATESIVDPGLQVVTMVVSCGGSFFVGGEDTPIAPDAEARIMFANRDEDSERKDAGDLGGGLLVQNGGRLEVYGAKRTSYAIAVSELTAGSDVIELSEQPVGWRAGDRIVVPGVRPWRIGENQGDPACAEDEEFTIQEIDGKLLFLGPKIPGVEDEDHQSVCDEHGSVHTLAAELQFDHIAPLVTGVGNKALQIPIANLTRNVIFQSVERARRSRAHVLFSGQYPPIKIEYAAFNHLGRTDTKSVAVDMHLREVNGEPTNTKGRYPLHFHLVDSTYDRQLPAHEVRGSVVEGSLKHGYVNHGGHVNMTRNVGYDNAGSHFFMENGQELGVVRENLAIFSRGSNEPIFNGVPAGLERSREGDFGHAGHGFWGHGGGVIFAHNFAFSHAHAAYIVYPLDVGETIDFPRKKLLGVGNGALVSGRYLQKYLRNRAIIHSYLKMNGKTSLSFAEVPIYTSDNVGASSLEGIRIGFHVQPGVGTLPYCLPYHSCDHSLTSESVESGELFEAFRSYIVDSQFWNNRKSAIFYGYAMIAKLSNLTLVGPPNGREGVGIARNNNHINGYMEYEHVLAMGFSEAVQLPLQGENYANNVVLVDNDVGLYLQTAAGPRAIEMTNIKWFRNTDDVVMSESIWFQGGSVGDLFYKDEVTINGERHYFPDQIPNPREYPAWQLHLESTDPNNLMTAAQLWHEYRLAIGGQLQGQTEFAGNVRLLNHCQRYHKRNGSKLYLFEESHVRKTIDYTNPGSSGWHVIS